ncbi:centrosomal protein of 89 kDa isoform X1 [Labrus mixtus]|uniref:centrosomal protein of 89 kDa isoform X1 n=1 Tax=Labrus mixtus TaxID=508554 RepID=UPI0029C08AF4|nr:centrosomal protein of 89 kDa isoform X1 [Labrus mixtus]
MLKFNFRRDKDQEFRHIAPGLIPAASIAPKPAVPRTPPPRSPSPSPERPRSALAAAILSSSLTGQTWALPPIRPRSFSESDQSESFISEPNISTALYTRDRWSEDLASRPRLSSPEHSEEELKDKEDEVDDEEDREEHVYQTLGRQENCSVTEPVYAVSLKPKSVFQTSTTQLTQMSEGRAPSPELIEKTSVQSPEDSCNSSKKQASVSRRSRSRNEDVTATLPILTTDQQSPAATQQSPEPRRTYGEAPREAVRAPPEKNSRMVDDQKLLEERLQRLEQDLRHSRASSNLRSSAGSQAELQNLRQHAQELVDENDALKLTVHRLNVELSGYQTRFRPLSKLESSRISGLPKTGSPPPWLLDVKHLSPLLLAYEDRMNEKDALLQITEEEVKRLRVHVEEVIKENDGLHDEIAKIGGVSQKDCHQLQQQALLVLQENQVLIDQLEAQHAKAKANHSRHYSEVSKVSKQLMLLEAEKQSLQKDLEESRRELERNVREVQVLKARLEDSVTWDEHCNIAGKLRRQLEQQESRNKSEMDEMLFRLSSLQEENRSLAVDKANLSANLKRLETELEVTEQASRKAERRMSVLKKQKDECVLKEENTRHYMGAVISVAEHVSRERDQLLQMASALQQEKQGFISRILKGTDRFGKLQEEVKVYRRKASSRLAVLEEAAEGRTDSYQREILHLQRLLRERQEAEERLLQSKREVEEELEVVWQAATRENQQIWKTVLDSKHSPNLLDQATTSNQQQQQPHSTEPLLSTSHQSSTPQRKAILKSDSNNSFDEKQKYGLDFYC